MFDHSTELNSGTPVSEAIKEIANFVAPTSLANEKILPVDKELASLFPSKGIRRGSIVSVSGDASVSLAIALTAEISRGGNWIGVVGLPSLGLSCVSEMGIPLQRWVFIDQPKVQIEESIAVLAAGVDLILLGEETKIAPSQTRRFVARIRAQGSSVIFVTGKNSSQLTFGLDLSLSVESSKWLGLGVGHGRLSSRRVEVSVSGRGAASRSQKIAFWLPNSRGEIQRITHSTTREKKVIQGRPSVVSGSELEETIDIRQAS